MKILFLVPYPLQEAPSQRFRFEQYFQTITGQGHYYAVQSFLNSQDWKVWYQSGKLLRKSFILLKGFLKRVAALFTITSYDFIFVHREVTPVGPPIFEWIIAKVLRKKIIYDFDDAIWLTDKTNEGWLERTIRWRSKVGLICRWSYKVSCGNEFLGDYARQYTNDVVLNPTTIDTENVHNPDLYWGIPRAARNDGKVIIGWTGSHSTLKYLQELEPVLQRLETRYSNLEFCVIADRAPELTLTCLRFKPWSRATEISDLSRVDIGIMPLPDDQWAKGKCGFKALQYMAMEIPTIASPVGVNIKIIKHAVNGFSASTVQDWENYLIHLIEHAELRKGMGEEGRKTVVDSYSVSSNSDNFLRLFNDQINSA